MVRISSKNSVVKLYLLVALLLGSVAVFAQSPPPAAAALSSALIEQPAATLSPVSYEERLAKAEARQQRNAPKSGIKAEYWATPWLVYFEAYDRTRNAAMAKAAATDGTVGEVPRSNVLDVAWAGAMTASWNVTPGGAASRNWTYAAGALLLLDVLTTDTANNQRVAAHEKARMLTLTTPSIHFVKRAPGAFANGNGYDTIRESSAMIAAFGLQCTPALLNAPAENGVFVGGPSPGGNYRRVYACGFGAGEIIPTKQAGSEVKQLWLTSYTDAEPILRFSLTNLPTMEHMRRVLGTTDDAQMGRAAYERVKEYVPPDWTVVFTAPNEAGKWTVYVARNGVIDAFDAPDKL